MKNSPSDQTPVDPILDKALAKAAKANPEFSKVFGHYAMYVPEFSDLVRKVEDEEINYGFSKRAAAEIKGLVFDKKGNEYSDRKIKNNVELYVLRIRAKLEQLLGNPVWMQAFKEHEQREDTRLKIEQAKKELGGANGNMAVFVRRRFVADTIDNLIDKGAPKKTFDSSAPSKEKLVQSLLVHPTERRILDTEEAPKEEALIANEIIDPALITDTLLKNIGLSEFIMPKRARKKARLTRKIEAIPQVKNKLLEMDNIVQNLDGRDLKEKYFRSYSSSDGYILGVSNANQRHLFRANLVDAVNRLKHIRDNQGEEIDKLLAIKSKIEGVDYAISNDWENVKSSDELGKIKAVLFAQVEELKLVSNEFKKELRELLEDCVTMESTLTRKTVDKKTGEVTKEMVIRLNPGAKRAKLNKGIRNIGKRINQITTIKKFLAADESRLVAIKKMHDKLPFDDLKDYIESKAKENQSRPNKTREIFLSDAEKIDMQRKLGFWLGQFNKPLLEPYRCFGEKLSKKIKNALDLLQTEQVERRKMAEIILHMYLITKLKAIWDKLQNIYERNLVDSNNDFPYFLRMADELKELLTEYKNKVVAKSIQTGPFNSPYHKIKEVIIKMLELSNQGREAKKWKNDSVAMNVKNSMHKAMEEIDIVTLVRSIE